MERATTVVMVQAESLGRFYSNGIRYKYQMKLE